MYRDPDTPVLPGAQLSPDMGRVAFDARSVQLAAAPATPAPDVYDGAGQGGAVAQTFIEHPSDALEAAGLGPNVPGGGPEKKRGPRRRQGVPIWAVIVVAVIVGLAVSK